MVATLNNGGGFYSREFYVHEARMNDGKMLPPCVNTSRDEAVIRCKSIYLGLAMLQAVEDETIHRILHARERGGAFSGLDNFLDRDALVYFHENTVHAFEVDGSCEDEPAESALISIWARTDAHEKLNDYGSTRLCECSDEPNTPAVRGKKFKCQLTKMKY